MRRLLLIAVALLGLAVPAVAQAAGTTAAPSPSAVNNATSPFSFGVPNSAATATATTPAPTVLTSVSSSSGTGNFSGLDALLIAAGVALVIAGIAVYVWRDARSAARHLHRAGLAGSGPVTGTRPGSKSAPRPRKLSAQEKRRRKRGRAPRRR